MNIESLITVQLLFTLSIGFCFASIMSFADAFTWRLLNAFYRPCRKKITQKWSYILSARSFCESCEAKIQPFYLIPVVGALCIKFQCSKCQRPISKRFFWGEILAFTYGCALVYVHFQFLDFIHLNQNDSIIDLLFFEMRAELWYIFFAMLYFFIGYIIMSVDYEFLLIPTEAIVCFMFLGLVETYFFSQNIMIDLAVSFFWMSLFWLIRILSRYKMGFADVILIFALSLGLFFPQQFSLPALGSLLGIMFYITKKIHAQKWPVAKKLPLGSFLVIAFLFLRLMKP